MTSYYLGREIALAEIFGAATVMVADDHITVDGRRLPVVDDVIVTLAPDRLPAAARRAIDPGTSGSLGTYDFAEEIQFTFGAEWTEHGELMPEHEAEFEAYFDLIDLNELADMRVADLGCGSGRWASFVAPHCREIVLMDFSDAIFVARRNLRGADNAIFVLGDVLDLPFSDDTFDFSYCLGVLHHLPVDALDACRSLARLGPRALVYLYYSLDNRPAYYRVLLVGVTKVRAVLTRIRSRRTRAAISLAVAASVYWPMSALGTLAGTRARRYIPLADTYAGKSLRRLQQDAYDRFFTGIEQRFSRQEIEALRDTFRSVRFSEGLPYWHFVCTR